MELEDLSAIGKHFRLWFVSHTCKHCAQRLLVKYEIDAGVNVPSESKIVKGLNRSIRVTSHLQGRENSHVNRPFENYLVPLFQNEASYKTFQWNSFSYELLRGKSRFETEGKSNSKMSYQLAASPQVQ